MQSTTGISWLSECINWSSKTAAFVIFARTAVGAPGNMSGHFGLQFYFCLLLLLAKAMLLSSWSYCLKKERRESTPSWIPSPSFKHFALFAFNKIKKIKLTQKHIRVKKGADSDSKFCFQNSEILIKVLRPI